MVGEDSPCIRTGVDELAAGGVGVRQVCVARGSVFSTGVCQVLSRDRLPLANLIRRAVFQPA